MRKIENWEEVYKNSDEVVEFDKIPVGPQISKITQVQDIEDREYLLIFFDIVDGEYKGFFRKQSEKLGGDWPFQGRIYMSYKKSAERFFAGFIKAIEKSNNDFEWAWDKPLALENKFFVANFGEEEYLDEETQEIKTSIRCLEKRSLKALKNKKIDTLKKKTIKKESPQKDTATPEKNENLNDIEDDLPF